jgi:hypothetical protein
MESMTDQMVEIVFDSSKKKLRARPVNGEGWVRFPRGLRVEGTRYMVDELRRGKAGSWIACGTISEVNELVLIREQYNLREH